MAKPPPVECFNVTFGNVSIHDLGPLMAAGIKLGHSNVHYDLVTNIPTFKQRPQHEVKGSEFLKPWIAEHPTFRAKEAVTHFDLHGRAAGGAYSALRDLVKEGLLKSLGDGNYSLKNVKALAAPKKKPEKKKPEPDHTKRYNIKHSDLILQVAKLNGDQFHVADMKKLFAKRRRPPDSVGTSIKNLLTRGMIERVAEGEYKVLKSKNNGAATEASHG
jgi:hypothetical protein